MSLSEEKQMEIVLAPLEEAGKFVRLVLGLSTGAVVLFTNLAVSAQFSRWLRVMLVASLLMFGLAAVQCLFIFFRFLETRAIFAKSFTAETEKEARSYQPKLDALVETVTTLAARLMLLLAAGILFAVAFVTSLVFVR